MSAGSSGWWAGSSLVRGLAASRSVRVVAVTTAAALTLTLGDLSMPSPAAALAPVAAVKTATSVSSRPDVVSAQVTARAQGSRVEVESLRDETSTTWVNPDGTLTTEVHATPIRFRDAAGRWQSVDLSLVESPDGTVAPRGRAGGLSLAGATAGAARGPRGASGTDLTAVRESRGRDKAERVVTLGWPGKLRRPTVEGTTATYADVQPGVDVVIDARRNGYEQHIVIKTPAARDALVTAAGGKAVSWTLPVKTEGLTARAEKDGSVSFVDADGLVVSRLMAPIAWDAVIDPRNGDHVNTSPVAMTVIPRGKNRATITLAPDLAWLSDPARQFPITVDPTYASVTLATSFDTYVQSNVVNTDESASTELRAGTWDGGATKTRSYINFSASGVLGKDIVAATAHLYETYSYSCTVKPLQIRAALSASTATRWASQPATSTAYSRTMNAAKGYSSSCAAGWLSADITNIVDMWSRGSETGRGLALFAGNEADSYGYKKFASRETTHDPYITFTYNRKPNAAAAPTMANGVSYGGATYVAYGATTVSSVASDPDGSTVAITFQVWDGTGTGASQIATCTAGSAGSGKTASCQPAPALPNNKQLYVKAAVKDDRGLWNGAWSPWTTFRTALSKPVTPTVDGASPQLSCAGHPNGSWTDTVPTAAVPCTVTIPASPAGVYNQPVTITGSVDGVAFNPIATNQQAGTFGGISVPTSKGSHTVAVSLHTASTWSTSPNAVTSFGWGGASMNTPTVSPRATTTGRLAIVAAGPPRGTSSLPTATLRWRVASSGQDESAPYWNDATGVPLTVTENETGVSVSGSWDTTTATTDATLDSDSGTAGVQPTTLNPRVPVLLDVQVCLTYSTGTQCTWSQSKTTVMRLPHAFGNGFPTSAAGPGQVALFTGEFNTDATDVSVPGYTGDLSLSRSHSTYGNNPTAATDAPTGVFGPGWTANLDGGDAGLGGLRVIDSTRVDGTLAFLDSDGSALIFLAPGSAPRRTGTNLAAGEYLPADEDTALSGTTLAVAGSGASTTLTLTEDDGTKTAFTPAGASTAPAVDQDGTFTPSTVTEPGSLQTSYNRDGVGRVTRILAPIPPGVVPVTGQTQPCPDAPVANMAKGCRALRIAYGDGTTATGNTPAGQVWQVTAELYNPTTMSTHDCVGATLSIPAGMASVPVACYTYDTGKRLASVKDPRTQLTTTYAYGTSNQLTSLSPPGQSPITLAYSTLEGRLKLTAVTRAQPAPLTGTAQLTRVVYNVPTSGSGLADLSQTATDSWGQAKAPTFAAAVFGPEYTGTISQADGQTPNASDWTYADLSYTTADGYTVNTASYGVGAWQRTSADYDEHGNVTRSLDASAINEVLSQGLAPAMADQYATATTYNDDIRDSTGQLVLPAGSRVSDTYEPIREVVLPSGALVNARPHSDRDYDQGAPNLVNGVAVNPATGEAWSLPTTITTDAVDAVNATIAGSTLSTTKTDYTAQVTGTGDGWGLGVATKVTTVMDGTGSDISQVRVYDSIGRVTATRQPLSSGSDAGTTNNVYYTADATASDDRCDSKPEWAGLSCLVGPAAAAATAATPANGPATLPTTNTLAYSLWLAATLTVETSGTATRTSTTTMDAAGRPTMSAVSTTNLGANGARPAVFTHYDPSTGQADYTGPVDHGSGALADGDKTVVSDVWGRPTAYRSEAGDVTTTVYDGAGRVVSVTDPKGTTTTTWDGVDAEGRAERRGLPTAMSVSRAGPAGGSGSLDFAGAYDANGALVTQQLPGAITQHTVYDVAGQPTAMSYDGQVTPMTARTDANGDPVLDGDGNPIYDPGTPTTGTWMAWTQANDSAGRVRLEYTGAGSSFDPATSGATSLDQVTAPTGSALAYDRAYTYDTAGRLTGVQDRTATSSGTTLDPSQAPTSQTPCAVRAYGFDRNGRRTSLTQTDHDDGACTGTTSTTTTNLTYSYDSADRLTTAVTGTLHGATTTAGTYTYDAFGRQTLIPATDAPDRSAGNIQLGYYDDDLAHTITQGTMTTTLDLDSGGRRVLARSTDSAASTTTTLERHYSDASDNPAWTVHTDAAGTPTTTRYAESLGGDLAATIAADGAAQLSLATLHGDVVTTVDIAASQASTTPCTGITGWADYTEYGTPRDPATATATAGDAGYGWLGAKQRSTTTQTAGLTLMGDRLYNPTTGRFTSTDPEPGGSDNAYAYPTDPVNMYDLNGRWWNRIRRIARRIGFRTGNKHFVWRGRRPAFHWEGHAKRIERGWRGKKGKPHWHFNDDSRGAKHRWLPVREGLKQLARDAAKRAGQLVARGGSGLWVPVAPPYRGPTCGYSWQCNPHPDLRRFAA